MLHAYWCVHAPRSDLTRAHARLVVAIVLYIGNVIPFHRLYLFSCVDIVGIAMTVIIIVIVPSSSLFTSIITDHNIMS